MYNSITITVLAKIWHVLELGYKYSFLRKIIGGIGEIFKNLGKGSRVLNLFISEKKIAEESLFYSIYCRFIDSMYIVIKKLREVIEKRRKNSLLDRTIVKLFENNFQVVNTFLVFLLSFSFTIIIINIVKGIFFDNILIISIIIALLSLIGLSLNLDYKEIINNSGIYKFLKEIFSIDEGGNK